MRGENTAVAYRPNIVDRRLAQRSAAQPLLD
jgi:hypothetical protein